MRTKNSTLELFALKSYVSVLPETEKKTALKIVGGHEPPDTGGRVINIYNQDHWDIIDSWFDGTHCQNGPFGPQDPFFVINNHTQGDIEAWRCGQLGGLNPTDRYINEGEWKIIKAGILDQQGSGNGGNNGGNNDSGNDDGNHGDNNGNNGDGNGDVGDNMWDELWGDGDNDDMPEENLTGGGNNDGNENGDENENSERWLAYA